MNKFIINTDGASRGNPGQAAAGFTIKTADGVIWVQEGAYLGVLTNNEAEYQAVILALKKFLSDFSNKKPYSLEIISDSLLIISQLKGAYKVKNERLREYFMQVKELEKQIGPVTYTHSLRGNNQLADQLANIALDTHA